MKEVQKKERKKEQMNWRLDGRAGSFITTRATTATELVEFHGHGHGNGGQRVLVTNGGGVAQAPASHVRYLGEQSDNNPRVKWGNLGSHFSLICISTATS